MNTDNTKYFLISFCCDGFECIQDITDHVPDNFALTQAQHRLSGEDAPQNPVLTQIGHMRIRAMANAQRDYEIYTISAVDVELTDLREWAETDPQSLADWVRKYHQYLHFSGRVDGKSSVIV